MQSRSLFFLRVITHGFHTFVLRSDVSSLSDIWRLRTEDRNIFPFSKGRPYGRPFFLTSSSQSLSTSCVYILNPGPDRGGCFVISNYKSVVYISARMSRSEGWCVHQSASLSIGQGVAPGGCASISATIGCARVCSPGGRVPSRRRGGRGPGRCGRRRSRRGGSGVRCARGGSS